MESVVSTPMKNQLINSIDVVLKRNKTSTTNATGGMKTDATPSNQFTGKALAINAGTLQEQSNQLILPQNLLDQADSSVKQILILLQESKNILTAAENTTDNVSKEIFEKAANNSISTINALIDNTKFKDTVIFGSTINYSTGLSSKHTFTLLDVKNSIFLPPTAPAAPGTTPPAPTPAPTPVTAFDFSTDVKMQEAKEILTNTINTVLEFQADVGNENANLAANRNILSENVHITNDTANGYLKSNPVQEMENIRDNRAAIDVMFATMLANHSISDAQVRYVSASAN
ncbi:hypothetical protein [Rickettsia endosymbiont of Cardiosporidium cionae]|uniref:hypothetical protein n=1 Tax=Rickettsia endosymbiont of Cardiosporidium cionae TaxID=2777155 RepID=UPI0018940C76|nr:hypothetical protein [Rickettsia endosymbiont of Cardiosporidium cionae]